MILEKVSFFTFIVLKCSVSLVVEPCVYVLEHFKAIKDMDAFLKKRYGMMLEKVLFS